MAFHASWHEARLTSKEDLQLECQQSTLLKQSSFKIDEKAHSELVRKFDQAKHSRDSRRLLRCAQPHASGFVTKEKGECVRERKKEETLGGED